MRPTAYRRNAHHLRDRHAFEGIPCRLGRCLLPATPKPRSLSTSARCRVGAIVFWDEWGDWLLPVTRRTWAPRGSSPVIRPTSSGGGPVAVVSSDHTTGRKGWLASPIPTWEVLQVSGHAAMLVAGRQHAGDRRSSGDGREPW
jgi:hypothetical protein